MIELVQTFYLDQDELSSFYAYWQPPVLILGSFYDEYRTFLEPRGYGLRVGVQEVPALALAMSSVGMVGAAALVQRTPSVGGRRVNGKNRKWSLLVVPLLVLSLMLAACAGEAVDTTEEPGVVEPGGIDEGLDQEGEALGEEVEEPLAPEEPTVEPTVELTEEVTEEPTAEPTEGVQFAPATTEWVSSERLVGMTIYSQDGTELGTVSDLLMSEQGDVRYVIFDAVNVLSDDAEQTMVAADWSQFQVNALQSADEMGPGVPPEGQSGDDDGAEEVGPGQPPEDQTGAQGGEDDGTDAEATPADSAEEVGPGQPPEDQTDEGDAGTGEAGPGNPPSEREELVLVYAGDPAQLETMTFDPVVLDESGLFVDEAALTAAPGESEMVETPAEGEDAGDDAAAAGEDAQATPSPEAEATEADDALLPEGQRLIRVSDIDGFGLVNENGENLGSINQVLFSTQGMSVPYALADIGGFLGIGANTIAIPWDRLTIDAEQEEFVLAATQEQLEQAPTIDVDAIETEGFANQVEIDTFWQGLDAGGMGTGTGGDDTGSGDDTGASGSLGTGGGNASGGNDGY